MATTIGCRRNKKPIMKSNNMKTKIIKIGIAMALMVTAAQAASLNPVQVNSNAINFLFNIGCSNTGTETSSPIALPGTTGTGYLLTRVTAGESNSAAAGLFSYEYRIDLSGVMA